MKKFLFSIVFLFVSTQATAAMMGMNDSNQCDPVSGYTFEVNSGQKCQINLTSLFSESDLTKLKLQVVTGPVCYEFGLGTDRKKDCLDSGEWISIELGGLFPPGNPMDDTLSLQLKNGNIDVGQVTISAVPVPSAIWLFVSGLIVLIHKSKKCDFG